MRCFWTEEEDENLKKAVEKCTTQDRIQWKAVSKCVGTRTSRQCMQRWIDVLRPGIKKGTWSKSEDIILQRIVILHGFRNWTEIARLIPKRTAKQCRERWHQNLAPHLSKQPFSSEDDELLLKLFENYGSKWTVIAKHFKNRSANLIKCRWKSLRRQLAKSTLKNRIEKTKQVSQNGGQGSKYSKHLINAQNILSSVQQTSSPSPSFTTFGHFPIENKIPSSRSFRNLLSTTPTNDCKISTGPMKEQVHFTWSILPRDNLTSEFDQKITPLGSYCNCQNYNVIELISKDQSNPRRVSGQIDSFYQHHGRNLNTNGILRENCPFTTINRENSLNQNILVNNYADYGIEAPTMYITMCHQNQLNPNDFYSHDHNNCTMRCDCFRKNNY